MRRVIPGAADGWTAAGFDEFLRAYLTPAGRAAFYAAARHIYLEAAARGRRLLDAPAHAAAGGALHLGPARPARPAGLRHATWPKRCRTPATSNWTAGTSPGRDARQDPRGDLPLPDRLNRVRLSR